MSQLPRTVLPQTHEPTSPLGGPFSSTSLPLPCGGGVPTAAILVYWGGAMQDREYGLRRTPLRRSSQNFLYPKFREYRCEPVRSGRGRRKGNRSVPEVLCFLCTTPG